MHTPPVTESLPPRLAAALLTSKYLRKEFLNLSYSLPSSNFYHLRSCSLWSPTLIESQTLEESSQVHPHILCSLGCIPTCVTVPKTDEEQSSMIPHAQAAPTPCWVLCPQLSSAFHLAPQSHLLLAGRRWVFRVQTARGMPPTLTPQGLG